MKPKVTFVATPIVWIEVMGEPASDEQQARAAFPICPNDGGLVLRLSQFMEKEEIWRAVRPGHAGGGSYSGGFYEPHAKKIIAWLRKEGCKRTEQK